MDVKEKIEEWFAEGAKDFETGFALLNSISRNQYFMSNIYRRRNLAQVKHELDKIRQRKVLGVLGVPGVLKVPEVLGVPEVTTSPCPDLPGEGSGTKGMDDLTLPSPARRGDRNIIIRKEFPFLGKQDCPEELKILVSDMITAHANYMAGHKKLYEVANKDNGTCFKTASEVVENYIENRNIWEELEHYKKNGEVLGNHRVFAERKRKTEIDKMDFKELQNLFTNLQRRIAYRARLIEERPDDDNRIKWLEEIRDLEKEKKLTGIRLRKRGRRKK